MQAAAIGLRAATAYTAPLAAVRGVRCSRGDATRAVLRMNFFANLLQEMDNFADDAMGRRLGNGAKFYGKRRSSFYGEDDELRKEDPQAYDSAEDYSGPAGGSYFVLSDERDAQGRPMGFLTRKEAREQQIQKEEERSIMITSDDMNAAFSEKFFQELAASEAAANNQEQE